MAGKEEPESPVGQREGDSSFVWDDESQLYFHASSGFYHNPNAGWYFNGWDGLYYKFEDGGYVLLESGKEGHNNSGQMGIPVSDEAFQYEPVLDETRVSDEAVQNEPVLDESVQIQSEPYYMEGVNNDKPTFPPLPSEWLEASLADFYSTGYSNSAFSADEQGKTTETDVGCDSELLLCDAVNVDNEEIEEGTSLDEEYWRAQYGQVIQPEEDDAPTFPITDLWDWALVTETVEKTKHGRKKKHQVIRLVGKLVKPSSRLHPSVPSGSLFKTAAICEVHLSLVRVSSGQVYRLKAPSIKYLTTLSAYDSSDPTRDWGFPDLSIDKQGSDISSFSESCVDGTPRVCASEDSTSLPDQLPVLETNKGNVYRDRASERRALHGGYGVGPGQKKSGVDAEMSSSPVNDSTELAAAEALNMSFGTGSFARRMLESMGWKEGEALGKTTKGLLQPLEAVGNKGFAGLGWEQRRPNHT